MKRIPLLLFLLFVVTGCASSNILRWNAGALSGVAVDGTHIRISGVLTQATADHFVSQLDQMPGGQLTVDLDSPGGEVGAALRIHDRLKASNRPVVTRVANGARCMSSCTLIFAAGNRRIAGTEARFRFHSPRYIGRFPLPRPAVLLIEATTRRAMRAVYAGTAPDFARYLADSTVRALDTREGKGFTGTELAARRDGFVTELAH